MLAVLHWQKLQLARAMAAAASAAAVLPSLILKLLDALQMPSLPRSLLGSKPRRNAGLSVLLHAKPSGCAFALRLRHGDALQPQLPVGLGAVMATPMHSQAKRSWRMTMQMMMTTSMTTVTSQAMKRSAGRQPSAALVLLVVLVPPVVTVKAHLVLLEQKAVQTLLLGKVPVRAAPTRMRLQSASFPVLQCRTTAISLQPAAATGCCQSSMRLALALALWPSF